MHVFNPCPTKVAGNGGWLKQVMGSHSYERDYCHTHRSSAQFFFHVKKLSCFWRICLPLLKGSPIRNYKYITVSLHYSLLWHSFFSQLSVSIDPVYSLKSRIWSLKMSLKVLEWNSCHQSVSILLGTFETMHGPSLTTLRRIQLMGMIFNLKYQINLNNICLKLIKC